MRLETPQEIHHSLNSARKCYSIRRKINISNLFISDWIRKGEVELEQDRYLDLPGGFNDTGRAACVKNGKHTEVDAFQSDHEEADSHIHHPMKTFSPERVVCGLVLTPMLHLCVHIMHSSAILLSCSSRRGVSQRQ